jgi:OOP family OmpA-OmpF porin
MHSIRILTIASLASLLGASVVHAGSNASPDWNVGDVRAMTQHGNQFQQNLHREYVALAQSEQTEESDSHSMVYYDHKARLAAAGSAVAPTMMTERDVPAEYVTDLTDGRAALMRMLDAGGPSKAPVLSAHAQSQFDCWIEEQTENRQPKKIALCRDGFNSSLMQASTVVFEKTPEKAPAPMAAAPGNPPVSTYTVYFDHNSLNLSPATVATNQEVINLIKSTGAKSVRVSGYTDTSGNHEYNRTLAEKRAMVVSNMLESSGIKPEIDTQSFGEDRLAVTTTDDVRNWQNRRVVIRVQ